MSKEALKLALEALELHGKQYPHMVKGYCLDAITAIKESLKQPEPNYKKALEVWLDKTEWVQETVKPYELGMHRADVLKQRIEATLAQPEQPKVRTGNCLRVGICASEGHKIAPQRTWTGLTNEETVAIELGLRIPTGYRDAYDLSLHDFAKTIEAKLKEKNT